MSLFLKKSELSGDRYKWTALAVASLGTLVGILNASTLIIALPTMMVKLNTTLIGVTWVLIVYMLILTIIVSAMRGKEDRDNRKSGPDGSSGEYERGSAVGVC